jgi:hypothetical protein
MAAGYAERKLALKQAQAALDSQARLLAGVDRLFHGKSACLQ